MTIMGLALRFPIMRALYGLFFPVAERVASPAAVVTDPKILVGRDGARDGGRPLAHLFRVDLQEGSISTKSLSNNTFHRSGAQATSEDVVLERS